MLMRTLYRLAAVGALILMPVSVLAQFVADAVLEARGCRTKIYHRDGSNRVELTVPAA